MQKKSSTYLLIGGLILIWGLIIFRFLDLKENDMEPISLTNTSQVVPESSLMDKAKPLQLSYDDPFKLEKSDVKPKSYNSNHQPKSKPISEEPVKPAFVRFPKIKIAGIIENQDQQKPVAIVAINNVIHLMAEGETLDGLSLLSIEENGLQFVYQEEKKFYPWVK